MITPIIHLSEDSWYYLTSAQKTDLPV